jgi:apolipoprotein N-acyltransferase
MSFPDWVWSNGVVLIDPVKGLQPAAYVKRKLVPFGEYVPLRPVLGWIEKFAPIGGDFTPGATASPIPVTISRVTVPVGPLVCYEDIFPRLARESVLAGAELLAVQTNNGWFGTGGAAYQHATHSVLRAVENRRPVVRCGNAGWSGWIDEFGNIRGVLTGEDGTVYFRGAATHTITRDLRWHGQQTFYTLHGDWFLLVCAGLVVFAAWLLYAFKPAPARADGEPVF